MAFINIRKVLPLESNNIILYSYLNSAIGLLKSIIICNTLKVPSQVWLQVRNSSDPINAGSLLYGITLDPNETFELPERMILNGDNIIGWCDRANAISFRLIYKLYNVFIKRSSKKQFSTGKLPSGSGIILGDILFSDSELGAIINEEVLHLQPASQLFPGLVTIQDQDFQGDKSFYGVTRFNNLVKIGGLSNPLEALDVDGNIKYTGSLSVSNGLGNNGQILSTNGVINTWIDLETALETDPIFTSSPAFTITNENINNWNIAYGWGNHAVAGYLTSYIETDPIFLASPAGTITNQNITNWNNAYNWGDHSTFGYLTSIGDLQQVTDNGNSTTNNIYANSFIAGDITYNSFGIQSFDSMFSMEEKRLYNLTNPDEFSYTDIIFGWDEFGRISIPSLSTTYLTPIVTAPRMVVVGANGVLSHQAIPTSGPTYPYATPTLDGIVSTVEQSFGGNKRFQKIAVGNLAFKNDYDFVTDKGIYSLRNVDDSNILANARASINATNVFGNISSFGYHYANENSLVITTYGNSFGGVNSGAQKNFLQLSDTTLNIAGGHGLSASEAHNYFFGIVNSPNNNVISNLSTRIQFDHSGTISSYAHLHLKYAEGGGTLPTNYYGIYQEDDRAKNYFAGKISIAKQPYINSMLTVRGVGDNSPLAIFNRNDNAGWLFGADAIAVDDGIFSIKPTNDLANVAFQILPTGVVKTRNTLEIANGHLNIDATTLKIKSNNAIAAFVDSFGNRNTSFGLIALGQITTGVNNSAFGQAVLLNNGLGSENSGFGSNVLGQLTNGNGNAGLGYSALAGATTGSWNTAIGAYSLFDYAGSFGISFGSFTKLPNNDNAQLNIGQVIFGKNMWSNVFFPNPGDTSFGGKIGIMDTNPSHTLSVLGTFKINDGTQALGYVWTCNDINGGGYWAAATGGGGGGAETDPIFTASPAFAIASGDITNWNEAYGWGNHASVGYLTALPIHSHAFADITTKPTTLAGYGITDAYPLSANPAGYLTTNNGWNSTGNTGTNPSTNFIGTIDSQDFISKTNNIERVRIKNNGDIQFRNVGVQKIGFYGEITANAGYVTPTWEVFSTSNNALMTLGATNTAPNWKMQFNSSYVNTIIGGLYTTEIGIGAANTIGMKLFSSGNLLLGTELTTDSPRSLLKLTSTTKGFTQPRMTTVQRNAMTGLISISVSNGGSGYATAPTVSFTGGGAGATQATATAVLTGGVVTNVIIVTSGVYSVAPTVVFDNTGTGGTGAAATANFTATLEGTSIYNLTTKLNNTWNGTVWIDSSSSTTNIFSGVGTLVNGTVTINDSNVDPAGFQSRINVTIKNPSGTQGNISVPTRVSGTSFIVNSTSATENSDFDYIIVNFPI